MPEQAGDFDAVGEAVGIVLPHLRAEQPEVADDERAADDVQRVQSGQCEVNRVVSAVARAVVAAVRRVNLILGNLDFFVRPGVLVLVQVEQFFAILHVMAGEGDLVLGLFDFVAVNDPPVFERDFVVHELVAVFDGLDAEEAQRAEQRDGVEHLELAEVFFLQRRPGQDGRDAGRDQH